MKFLDIYNKEVDKKYRPIPFWSWNERLDVEETKRQVRLMNDAGLGGYFMHARGGLETEYMGDEWFDNIEAAAEEGTALGMHSWAYDENGWPSGFGGGLVSGLGSRYQQKSLHTEPISDTRGEGITLPERDGYRYYYTVNEFYVDVLDKSVTETFVDKIYREYERRSGGRIDGFFTDEPQIWRGTGFPWSLTLEEKFKSRYGYSLEDNLDSLFRETALTRRIRLDYWKLVTENFSECFMKVLHDYATSQGYGLTGHLVCEETFLSQLTSNGACMPHYEYFTIPGMDWLCRPVYDCLTPMQLSSAAAQTGKRQILSETFAASGHNISFGELYRIYEWQMVHGVNLLCSHLEGYSLRGIRKRDYPPAMYCQQPWWSKARDFHDTVSRIGMLLSEGELEVDILVLHTQSSAWALYNGFEGGDDPRPEIERLNKKLLSDMRALEDKHHGYHLGDEIMIERHGRVENGKFIIGKMSYSTLVIPEHEVLLPYTEKLIEKFIAEGGRVLTPDELAPNPITPESRLSYTSRRFEDATLHYFVNTDNSPVTASITSGDLVLDPLSGSLYPFSGEYSFEPYESLIVIDRGEEQKPLREKKRTPLSLLGEWTVESATPNSLTLDTCDYYFDGELIEKDGYVLNILPRLLDRRRPTALRQIYRFTLDSIPAQIYLATETPELFSLRVNGIPTEMKDVGQFVDRSFRLIPIAGSLRLGENELELCGAVTESEKTYNHLDRSWKFESMKNSLSYDTEIEPVYIVGDFGVKLQGEPEELPKCAYRISERPIITEKPKTVLIEALDRSGFPEFAGELTLSREFDITDTDRTVRLFGYGMNAITLEVNGEELGTVMHPPYSVDISHTLKKGKNRITLKIANNLRNLLGPHHAKDGELYAVSPGSFYKESNVFAHPAGADGSCHDLLPSFDDRICLTHFALRE